MNSIWVVVANNGSARIFNASSRTGPLNEIETLLHPEARLHEQELTSDTPGRAFDSVGAGRHPMGNDVDPKRQEAIKFCKYISGHLDRARAKGVFERLILVAAPAQLGLLRESMSTETRKRVVHALDKNLSRQSSKEIRQHLPEFLPTVS